MPKTLTYLILASICESKILRCHTRVSLSNVASGFKLGNGKVRVSSLGMPRNCIVCLGSLGLVLIVVRFSSGMGRGRLRAF
jgi:hypothetical protein